MLGRLTSAQTPEAGTTTYSYAVSGNACSGDPSAPCSRTDARNITTTYTYNDSLNRLTSKSYNDMPQTPTANYFYDQASVTIGSWSSPTLNYPKGRLTEATTTSSGSTKTAVVYSYDPVGRTKNFWQCNPSNCGLSSIWNTQYTYDWAGDVTSWVHPAGYTFTTPVNAAQQVTAVQSSLSDSTHPPTLAQNITYTAWGAVSSLQNGCVGSGCTNLQETYTYNNRLQPWMIRLGQSGGNLSADSCLVYNYFSTWTPPSSCPDPSTVPTTGSSNNGTVVGYWYQDNAGSYSHTATYAYDNVNRLTSATATGSWAYNLNFSYTRDGSNGQYGNMACVTAAPPCGNGNLTFNGNNQINSAGYTYGLQGNMTADGAHTYAYDAEGNLINVDGGSTITETYNALGWRVEANASGSVVDYLHDAAGQMIGGAWSGGSNQFIYFRGGLMAQYWNGASFAHINGLGSTQQFTDWSGGNPMDTLFYPWGQPGPTNSSVEALWAGFDDGNGWLLHEWQTDTRRYTQSASRWFTPDPLGGDITNPQSLNRYAYAINNPTTLIDPMGENADDNCTWDPSTNTLTCPKPPPEEASQSNQTPNVDWSWGASPDYFGGGGAGGGATPASLGISLLPVSLTSPNNATSCTLQAPSGNYTVDPRAVALFQPPMADAISSAFTNLNDQGIVPMVTSGFRTAAGQLAQQNSPYGAAQVSWHQVGMAVDINRRTPFFQSIVTAMTRSGLTWGSTFSRPDPVHFQDAAKGTTPSAVQVAACASVHH